MIRPILCALAFLPAAAPLHGDPLSKFTDLTPAEATRIPQEFALIECFKHPVKRAEVEGGLRIAMISMDRELKDEFIRLGGGECEVKDLVYSTVGVQFKAGNGQENFVVDVRILEVKESLEIWARIRVCSDGQYRVFKTPPDITPAEVERAKRWMDTLRGFLGSTEKLQALTVTNDKFSNPKNAKELYEAAAIWKKKPVEKMKPAEVINVFGEPTWSTHGVSTVGEGTMYFRKDPTTALKVDFAGGYVYKEPELVVVDEEIRSLER